MLQRFSLFLILLALPTCSFSQTKMGRLVLVLQDEDRMLVSGVEVHLQSGQTHISQKSVANGNGEIFFRGLPFGAYVISIDDTRFEPVDESLQINSEVSRMLQLQLKIRRLTEQVNVSASAPLVDPQKTNSSLYRGQEQIRQRMASLPNRDAVNTVASLPGWVLEGNGVLHPRGSEYQTQYVIDGIPMLENRSAAFASGPLLDATDSLEVMTGGIPAEFGRKLGGVVNVASRSATDQSRGEFELHGGNQGFIGGGIQLNGKKEKLGYSGVFSAAHTRRYLDPPVIENFSNQANLVSGLLRLDYIPDDANVFRIFAWANGTHLQVPNELFQEQAGQRQWGQNHDTNLSLGWDHYYSSRAASSLVGYVRQISSELRSNSLSTPVVSQQDRSLKAYGMMGSYSWVVGNHQWKVGGDVLLSPVHEFFSLAVTDATFFAGEGENPILEFTPEHPFRFDQSRRGIESSFYLQDHWHWKNITAQFGLRYDNYRFLVKDQAWSPRLGLGYYVPRTKTQIHISYDRAFQTPSIENLLLSSSDQARNLSRIRSSEVAGGLAVPTSQAHFYEAGFSQGLGRRLRIDGQVFRRSIRNFADDDVFFNTGLNFPVSLQKARIQGAELRLEMQNWQGLSGFASYSNLLGHAFSPVTGGLFVGEETRRLLVSGLRFPITQDQRNTLHAQIQYQPAKARWWVAAGFHYESGLPVELEEDLDLAKLEKGFSTAILDQVNFARGRVRPRQLWDLSTGVHLWRQEKRRATLQVDWINITNRFYLINFDGLFSGTSIGLPRTVVAKLSFQF